MANPENFLMRKFGEIDDKLYELLLRQKNLEKRVTDLEPKKPFPCPKCGSTNVYYDNNKKESVCLKCKYKWKVERAYITR